MVLTVEPGVYFNQVLLDMAFNSTGQQHYLIRSRIEEFWDFGGVRIEDTLVITHDGSLSLSNTPKRIDDIEAVMDCVVM